uniref:Uncharacterized protein n=1 Tax=Setaria digitata TaxID=48799 RepID=A0A915PZP5_9BILA
MISHLVLAQHEGLKVLKKCKNLAESNGVEETRSSSRKLSLRLAVTVTTYTLMRRPPDRTQSPPARKLFI